MLEGFTALDLAGMSALPLGTVESITEFNRRVAPPGTRFSYASIEPDVLGVVLHAAVRQSATLVNSLGLK